VDPVKSRTLVLIAKSLQNLANFVEFGNKEPHMVGVNPLILSRMSEMKTYLQDVCILPTGTFTPRHSSEPVDRNCAILYEICLRSSSKIVEAASTAEQNALVSRLLLALEAVNSALANASLPNYRAKEIETTLKRKKTLNS
jgi:hypothetical protein